MLLLTKALRATLPALYSQDGKGLQAVAHVRFFTPWSSWTWLATEFDGEDTFFGWADNGQGGGELGYFALSDFESVRGPFGAPGVERDRYFTPQPLADAIS